MLAIQVTNPPEKLPYKNAIKKMWTVLYFEEMGPSLTRLRIVGTGYDDDEESRKLRAFFERETLTRSRSYKRSSRPRTRKGRRVAKALDVRACRTRGTIRNESSSARGRAW